MSDKRTCIFFGEFSLSNLVFDPVTQTVVIHFIGHQPLTINLLDAEQLHFALEVFMRESSNEV